MIRFVELEVGRGGLPACTRCTPQIPATFTAAEQLLPRIAHVAASWDAGPGPNLTLVGAETFAHPELPALVMAASSSGFERLRLRTGASALAAHDNAEGATHAGVRHLEVVLLAEGASHDELAASPGAFASAMSGLAAFRTAAEQGAKPVAITGLVPLCRHNLALAAGAVAALAAAGAVAVEIEVTRSAASAIHVADHLRAAVETGIVNGVWVSVTGLSAKELPVAALHSQRAWEVRA